MTVKETPGGGRARTQRQARVQEQIRQQRRAARRRRALVGGAVALLLVLGGVIVFAVTRGTGQSRQAASVPNNGAPLAYSPTTGTVQPGGVIDGISCQEEMLNYHIHAQLTLYQNGRPVAVPADVGIPINTAINQGGQNYCLYFLHTHDVTGVVHIESPTSRLYHLGQFFDIWRYTAQWDAQGSLAAQSGVSVDAHFVDALEHASPSSLHVYVDGKPTKTYYKNIVLTAHKIITIELGKPLRPPRTSFDWQGQ